MHGCVAAVTLNADNLGPGKGASSSESGGRMGRQECSKRLKSWADSLIPAERCKATAESHGSGLVEVRPTLSQRASQIPSKRLSQWESQVPKRCQHQTTYSQLYLLEIN